MDCPDSFLQHLELIRSLYQSQPGFLLVYLSDSVDEIHRNSPANSHSDRGNFALFGFPSGLMLLEL